jgi:hypothetical protein
VEKENVIQRITSKLNLAMQGKGCETEEKKKSLCVIKHAMKRHGGVELWLLALLTWALCEEKWSGTRSGSFNTGETIQVSSG